MLKGVCVDTGVTLALKKDTTYYLFPNGENHFYVSKFPNKGAHFGCFHKKLFQIKTEPIEPPVKDFNLDPNNLYKGTLVYCRRYKMDLKDYYIKPLKYDAYFYDDAECKKLKGRFPLHWLENIYEINAAEIKEVEQDVKQSKLEKFYSDIQKFNLQGHSNEECLDYLRNIAHVIKTYSLELGNVGPYEFTAKNGKLKVYENGKEIDLYKHEQLDIFEFLAG